jgi:hypothetical protein
MRLKCHIANSTHFSRVLVSFSTISVTEFGTDRWVLKLFVDKDVLVSMCQVAYDHGLMLYFSLNSIYTLISLPLKCELPRCYTYSYTCTSVAWYSSSPSVTRWMGNRSIFRLKIGETYNGVDLKTTSTNGQISSPAHSENDMRRA